MKTLIWSIQLVAFVWLWNLIGDSGLSIEYIMGLTGLLIMVLMMGQKIEYKK